MPYTEKARTLTGFLYGGGYGKGTCAGKGDPYGAGHCPTYEEPILSESGDGHGESSGQGLSNSTGCEFDPRISNGNGYGSGVGIG